MTMNNDTSADAITQADRDAAAEVTVPNIRAINVRLGHLDDTPLVQAFARHRTTSLAAQDGLVDEILAHVERICGPISTEVCEVAGDDDRSVLRHNIGAVLWVSAIKGDKS